MAHYSYLEELERKSKRSQFYWLGFITTVLLAVIVVLVIIRRENELFVRIQEIEERPLTSSERMEIERKVLASWVKRDLGIDQKMALENRVLGSEAESEEEGRQAEPMSEKEKMDIEQKLSQ